MRSRRHASWGQDGHAQRAPLEDAGVASPHAGAEDDLHRVLATKVIPQLLTAAMQRDELIADCGSHRAPPTEAEVHRIGRLALLQDMPELARTVAAMTAEGLPLRSVLLDTIAPAARWLGQQWENDEISWMETTIGLSTLERLVAVLAHDAPPVEETAGRGLVALFAEPGEQHTLSIRVLGELLRGAGYRTLVDPRMPPDEVLHLVQSHHVSMVGMTTTTGSHVEMMRRLVADVARTSRNPHVLFVVGGATGSAAYASAIGATYCASHEDALQLLAAASRASQPGPG
jgi:methanogenic corrinoid protein MtbC1